MSLRASIQSGLLNQSSAQVIDGSLKFDRLVGGGTAAGYGYLTRTPSAGNRKTWTISFWVKRGHLGGADNDEKQKVIIGTTGSSNGDYFSIIFSGIGGEILDVTQYLQSTLKTNRVFRDPNAWMHILLLYDVNNATASDRAQLYINGVRETSFSSSNISSMSGDYGYNRAAAHYIGINSNVQDRQYFDGQLSQFYSIDGQALGPSYFGFTDPLTGTWRPKLLKNGDQATPNTQLLYNVNTSDNGFDSSSTSRTYDATNLEFSTYTTPQSANVGGFGANSAHVYKSPTGAAIKWLVSTDTSDRYIWTSEDGVNWTSKGSFYDTDGSTQSVTSTYIALAGGSNASNVTVTSAVVDFGTNGFYLPMDGNSPIGQDKSGNGNNWTPVNFGGFNSVDKATGALPILEGPGGIVANVATRTDENASSIALALPLVGNANDVHHHIKGSGSAKTITVNGNAAASSAQSNFYGGSFVFDGNGDYLRVTNDTDLVFGTGTFTIECWIYAETYNSVTFPTVISKYDDGDTSWILRLKSDGDIVWYDGNNNESTTQPISLNEWIHLAVVREGTGSNQTKVYVNGVLHVTHTDSSNYDDTNNIYIGRQDASNANEFDGYIQDVRIYKGVAKYTSNFVPASTSPDILPDTPSGVSGGSKLTKITDGAVNFRSNGVATSQSDYLDAGTSSDFTVGTSDDFTAECFIYAESVSDTTVFGIGSSTMLGYRIISGSPYLYVQSTGGILNTGTISANKWTHIAVTRSSGTLYSFIDGVLAGSVSNTGSFSASGGTGAGFYIGAGNLAQQSPPRYGFTGHVSNFRFVKDQALYTSAFTPPTEPLTTTSQSATASNVKLLCCQSNSSANSAAVSPATFSNSGDVYSSGISGSQDNTNGGGSAAAFDGQLGNEDGYGSYPNPGQTLTWTAANSDLGTTLAYSSTIRVYVNVDTNGDDGGLTVVGNNGSQTISAGSAGGRWVDISAATSPITSIAWSRASSGSQGVTLVAVEVDGSLLIDGFNGEAIQRFYDATSTTFNPFNTDINTVRGQETGYATFNPLRNYGLTTPLARYSEGNLRAQGHASTKNANAVSTLGASSGKWYFEVELIDLAEAVAITVSNENKTTIRQVQRVWDRAYAEYYDGSSWTNLGSGTQYTDGDIVGVAADIDNGKVSFYKNGISIKKDGTFTPNGDTFYFGCGQIYDDLDEVRINFGQKPFKFSPPEGYQPLNTANLRPSTVIARSDKYVGVTTYTGSITDTSSQTVTGINFQSDLVWIKRLDDANSHQLVDSVRGTGKWLESNSLEEENSTNSNGVLTSFNSKGFTLTGGSTNANLCCESGFDYVGWCWKAGGNKNTFNVDGVGYASASAAGITDGTISLTGASVGTRQGFSIIKYTGSGANGTLAHGLSQAPDFFFGRDLQDTSGSRDWIIYHKSIGATGRLKFTTDGTSTSSTFFQDTSPTNSLITVGTSNDINSTNDYILYCWHDVPGLQKFGKYSGVASADGPYIDLGFRPALVIFKRTTSHSNGGWYIYDSSRDPHNTAYNFIVGESAYAERRASNNTSFVSTYYVDFLSNGFKLRHNSTNLNDGSTEYIYMAWAEAPSFNLYGGQSNAR